MTEAKVVFVASPPSDAIQEMKAGVAEYFRTRGIAQKANSAMVVKTCILLALTFVPYLLILSDRFLPWEMLALAFLMGLGVAGIGFSVAHDALHGAYSSSHLVNRLLGMTFDLLGASSYLWKITHNIIHHTYTNIHGVDEDLAVSPLLRLSPRAKLLTVHRYQHLYAFSLYSLSTLFWVFVKDYKYLLQRDLGPYRNMAHPRAELIQIGIAKLGYYSWTLALPMIILSVPWWQVVIGFLAMNLTAGLILGVIFQLAHVVEGTDHPLPDHAGRIEEAWLVHEMRTTSNFARGNRLLTWYVGGLNYQIEHHLFPRICSVHYPAISSVVEDIARKHGLPYNDQPTLRAAILSHYRTLKRFGAPISAST